MKAQTTPTLTGLVFPGNRKNNDKILGIQLRWLMKVGKNARNVYIKICL